MSATRDLTHALGGRAPGRRHPRRDRRHAAGRAAPLSAAARTCDVWAKLEASNPGGSAKDRPAARMLAGRARRRPDRPRHDRGRVDLGQHGRRARAGLPLPRHAADLRRRRARARDERARHARARRRRARRLAARIPRPATCSSRGWSWCSGCSPRSPNSFWPDQYANESNPAAHAAGTMREIDEALGGRLDYLFVATSTTGTLRGCGDYLREHGREHADRRGRLDRQRALRRRARAAPAARLRRRRRDGALGGRRVRRARARLRPRLRRRLPPRSPSARRSSPARRRAASRSRSRRCAAQMEPGSRCAAIFPDGGIRLPRDRLRRRLGRARARLRAGAARRARRGGRAPIADAAPRSPAPVRVAIAGLGPKGLFALERLLDHARDLDPAARLEIDVFEPHPRPGAGPVYDPDQPAYLRMNFAADQLDMWWPASRAVPRAQRRRSSRGARRTAATTRTIRRAARSAAISPTASRPCSRTRRRNVDVTLQPHARRDVRAQRRRLGACAPPDATRALRRGADRGRPPGHVGERLARLDARRAARSGRVPGRAVARARARPARRDGRDPRLRAHVHRRRARAHRGPRRLVRAARPPVPPALRARRGRRRRDPPVHAHRPADAREARPRDRRARRRRSSASRADGARRHSIRRLERARSTCAETSLPILARRRPARASQAAVRNLRARSAAWGQARNVRGRPASACAIERSLAVGAGLAPPDRAWALGHAWRALYPAHRRAARRRRARRRATGPRSSASPREMERVAFGPPPVNAAKLLALVEAGRVDLDARARRRARRARRRAHGRCAPGTASATVDVVVDAVLPGPGALGHGGLLADLDRRRPRAHRAGPARARRRRATAAAGASTARVSRGPVGDRPPDRGLRDRQRHAQPRPASAGRPLGAPRRAALPRALATRTARAGPREPAPA